MNSLFNCTEKVPFSRWQDDTFTLWSEKGWGSITREKSRDLLENYHSFIYYKIKQNAYLFYLLWAYLSVVCLKISFCLFFQSPKKGRQAVKMFFTERSGWQPLFSAATSTKISKKKYIRIWFVLSKQTQLKKNHFRIMHVLIYWWSNQPTSDKVPFYMFCCCCCCYLKHKWHAI